MKKKFLFGMLFMVAMLLQAKKRTIVVRGQDSGTVKGHTEVTTGSSDSIIVNPSDDVTDIQVTIKDEEGEVISQYILPADEATTLEINTPNQPDGCLIQIEDNTGVVYAEPD